MSNKNEEEYYPLDPHKNDYRGMINPYHKFDIWFMKEQIKADPSIDENAIVFTKWNEKTKAEKKDTLESKFKEKYKKNQNPVDKMEIFNPNGEFDPNTNDWKIYPSPLFPWVEQWWDEMDEE